MKGRGESFAKGCESYSPPRPVILFGLSQGGVWGAEQRDSKEKQRGGDETRKYSQRAYVELYTPAPGSWC